MLVDVDEPIEAYKEPVLLGMDLTTSIIFAVGFICSIIYIAVIFLVFSLPLVVGVYTCWIPGAIIVVAGKKLFLDRVSFLEKRAKRKYMKGDIAFQSTESKARVRQYLADSLTRDSGEQDSEEEITKLMRTFKIGIAVIILVFLAVFVFAIYIKKGAI